MEARDTALGTPAEGGREGASSRLSECGHPNQCSLDGKCGMEEGPLGAGARVRLTGEAEEAVPELIESAVSCQVKHAAVPCRVAFA